MATTVYERDAGCDGEQPFLVFRISLPTVTKREWEEEEPGSKVEDSVHVNSRNLLCAR